MKKANAPLVWETDLPLFGPAMRRQWTLAMLATALVMLLLLGTIFVAQQEWDALPDLFAMVAGITAGLWLLGFAIMAILFRGRFRVRYTVDDEGILLENIEPVARKSNRAAIVIGILARKPGLVGSGMIGMSRESEAVRWKGAFSLDAQPKQRMLSLRNRWRSLLWVQCTEDNYADVLARVEQAMQKHKTASRVEARSPLPFYLKHSALILLAALPLFGLAEEYDVHLMAPILVLCFMLATLWLINLFAWVVYAGLLYIAVGVLLDLGRLRPSMFTPGTSYSGFDLLGGDDANLLLAALLAFAYLGWMCWRALRGGYLALLVRDASDMDGG